MGLKFNQRLNMMQIVSIYHIEQCLIQSPKITKIVFGIALVPPQKVLKKLSQISVKKLLLKFYKTLPKRRIFTPNQFRSTTFKSGRLCAELLCAADFCMRTFMHQCQIFNYCKLFFSFGIACIHFYFFYIFLYFCLRTIIFLRLYFIHFTIHVFSSCGFVRLLFLKLLKLTCHFRLYFI